ncbi:hypothetical protein, partial [Pseudomonas sp. KCJK8993]|uniref:hypothetical protein n=1 Tax=Pseudomonas sp. KCJK8993 TaxID=3344565 RepID=UPI0039068251
SGFEVGEDGIYLKRQPDWVLASLTKAEREGLLDHPRGRPGEPVLAFPFTLMELKLFLDWAEDAGHDFPINESALVGVIESQKAQPEFDASSLAKPPNQSDEALGAFYRERNREFAKRNQERGNARADEHQRWREAAAEIQAGRQRPATTRQLAQLVKESLGLPDSIETIRKRINKTNPGSG